MAFKYAENIKGLGVLPEVTPPAPLHGGYKQVVASRYVVDQSELPTDVIFLARIPQSARVIRFAHRQEDLGTAFSGSLGVYDVSRRVVDDNVWGVLDLSSLQTTWRELELDIDSWGQELYRRLGQPRNEGSYFIGLTLTIVTAPVANAAANFLLEYTGG